MSIRVEEVTKRYAGQPVEKGPAGGPSLFERFVRSPERQADPEASGMGLGLWIVQSNGTAGGSSWNAAVRAPAWSSLSCRDGLPRRWAVRREDPGGRRRSGAPGPDRLQLAPSGVPGPGGGGPERVTPVESGDFLLEAERQSVSVAGGPAVRLTRLELRLLQLLLANAGAVLPAERLLRHVWGSRGSDDRQLLKQLVHRLRQKIEADAASPCYLLTESGVGYRLRTRETDPA